MLKFLQRFSNDVLGVLSGLDRIRFRGTQILLANSRGMAQFLWRQRIAWKDFRSFAENATQSIRQAIEKQAEQLHRPVIYLNSSQTRKEDLARQLAMRDGIDQGLIAVLKCVE